MDKKINLITIRFYRDTITMYLIDYIRNKFQQNQTIRCIIYIIRFNFYIRPHHSVRN